MAWFIKTRFALAAVLLLFTPTVHATSTYVNTTNQQSTGFVDGTLNPFTICTTVVPNMPFWTNFNGQPCAQLTFYTDSYDGRRVTKGSELCSDIMVQKEGWYGFYLYVPDPGYPTNKNAAVAQLFANNSSCNSWAALFYILNNDLKVDHRRACVTPTTGVIKANLPRNRWSSIVIHYVVSALNAGQMQVWFDGDLVYNAQNINFGYDTWDANDALVPPNNIGMKFGQYAYDEANYETNGIRTLYYANVCQIAGNPTNAWATANPGVGSPGGLIAHNGGNGKISLNWNAVSNASGYKIYRSLTNGGAYAFLTNVATASFANTGLTNGVTYYYVVTATNAAGESPYSVQSGATPNPGTNSLTWVGGTSSDWDISTTTNWRNASVAYAFVPGDQVRFDNSASNATINLTDTVVPGSMVISNTSLNYVFTTSTGDSINGPLALVKSGSGSATFSGLTNNFGGGITLNAGTLDFGGGTNFAGPVTMLGGTLQNGTLDADSFAIQSGTASATLAGVGTTLTKSTTSTATLSGANTFSGATTVSAGKLVLSGNNSNATTPISISNGATLQLANSNAAAGSVVTMNSGATVELRADGDTLFATAGLGAIPYNSVLNFNVNQLVGPATNRTLTLNGAFAESSGNAAGGGFTLNVTGGNGYTLGLGALGGGNGTTTTLNPTTANLLIASYTGVGNSSTLQFTGTANTSVTGGITNGPGNKSLPFLFNQTGKVTLRGPSVTANGNAVAINSGTVVLSHNLGFSSQSASPTLGLVTGTGTNTSATLLLGGTDASGLTGGITLNKTIIVQDGGVTPNGGTLSLGGQNTSGTNIFSGNITLGATANTGKSVTVLAATGGEVDFTGVIATNGIDTSAGITVGNASNKGIVQLTAANTYAGGTLINAGILRVNNSAGSGTGSGSVTIAIGGALGGSGIISGVVTVQSGGLLTPGSPFGTLTVSNTVTLQSGSVTWLEINRTNAPTSDKLVANSIVAGGTLVVTNVGPTNFAAGDTFTLFSTAVTGFSAVNLPPLPFGKLWNNRLAIDGKIVITSINIDSTNVTFAVANNQLQLSWPSDRIGWRLETQTNELSVGFGTNWFTVAGSVVTNQITVPLDFTNPSVFFRLVYP